MTPFTVVTGPAAALDRDNVDTDQVLPARFLKKPRSAGYGSFLFADLRRAEPGFVLDRPEAQGAVVLVAGANFGCGSSREGAVYALVDAGLRCVVAPGFGDIFAGNAAKNGLLTVTLPAETCAALRRQLAQGGTMTVDLPGERLQGPDGAWHAFAVDAFRKRCLVEGLDSIALTLADLPAIEAWETADRAGRPWVMPGATPAAVPA